MAMIAICKIKYEASGQDANQAQGKANSFTGIEAAHRVLYVTCGKS